MEEPRIETRTQMGRINAIVNGQMRFIEVPLTIIDTYYPDGRKDCTVQVPRLEVNPQSQGAQYGIRRLHNLENRDHEKNR